MIERNMIRRHLWGDLSSDLLEQAQMAEPQAIFETMPSDLSEALRDYFRGVPADFNSWGININGLSAFSRKVYDAVRGLKWGEKASYSEIARQIGHPKAARAVGSALGKNPIPLFIPCHRVLSRDGEGGWSGPPGWKRRLLKLETDEKIYN